MSDTHDNEGSASESYESCDGSQGAEAASAELDSDDYGHTPDDGGDHINSCSDCQESYVETMLGK